MTITANSRVGWVGAIAVVLSLAGFAVEAQEKPTLNSVDSRLSRIERVLDQSLLEQLQRVDSLKRENRALRGEIESLSHELSMLKKRNADLYADTDRRITDLEESQDSLDFFSDEGGFLDETADQGLLDETQPPPEPSSKPSTVIVSEQSRAPVPSFPQGDFSNGPRPPAGAPRDTATQAEKAGYTRAYDLLARGQNDSAVRSFKEFLVSFPDGPYSDNAWYWLGEAMYAKRNFDAALRNFGVVVNSFPDSPKVPDARLKIGYALYEQQRYGEARVILTSVQNDYPGRSAAVLARKRLQMMDRNGV